MRRSDTNLTERRIAIAAYAKARGAVEEERFLQLRARCAQREASAVAVDLLVARAAAKASA